MMFRLIAILTFIGGVAVKAQSCLTGPNNVTFDTHVANIDAELPAIANANAPTDQELTDVFAEFCNNSVIESEIEDLATFVTTTCTEYRALWAIGPVTLELLLSSFDDYNHVCGCEAELVTAITFDATDYQHNEPTGQYTVVGDFPAMCDSATFNADLAALDNPACSSSVLAFITTGITVDNIGVTDDAITNACDADKQVNFDCAMSESSEADFKTCITDASTACAREDCLDTYMNCTTQAKSIYKVSVVFFDSTAFAFNCDSDSAANTATMSFLLFLSATIYAIFVAN